MAKKPTTDKAKSRTLNPGERAEQKRLQDKYAPDYTDETRYMRITDQNGVWLNDPATDTPDNPER